MSVGMENQITLREVLERHRGERHAIVLHEYPDPDAISAAYAHRLISANIGIDTTILYAGRISHQQNIALVKVLGIEMVQYKPELDVSGFQGSIFIDNQGTTVEEILCALEEAGVPAIAIIDHHEYQERLKPEWSDIRRVGATATLYTEYIEKGLLDLNKTRREHVILATALMHGILTDTGGFIKAGFEDFQAAAFLSQLRDADLLSQIMSQARSKQAMELIRRALGDRMIVENFSIAGVGYLRIEDRDAIPQAAEFLLTEENAHTAIVYGIVHEADQEHLVGSIRTSKITLDPDNFIKEVFGKNSEGHYYGGGKMSAGAFSIPIGFLVGDHSEKFQELKWQVYDAQIKYKILDKLGVERQVL
jgi:nanoRNase/pAp phosphatase (c-di-AMP/oligoRNAs hydrolase)